METQRPAWAQVLAEGILPNLERMVGIWNAGHIAVLFFDVDAKSEGFPECGRRCLGWDEKDRKRIELFGMKRQDCTRFINAIDCVYEDHKSVAQWLRRKVGNRLIVFVQEGVLCLNFDSEAGFIPEPFTSEGGGVQP